MSCSLATAALMAVCLTLPELGNAPPFKKRAEPQLTEWGMREVYLDYSQHKALWYENWTMGEFQVATGLGKVPKISSLFPGKKLYLYAAPRDYEIYLTSSNISVMKSWHFD